MELEKVSYTHDAMIDCIIANPAVSGGQLAAVFGFTPAWVSQVVGSDGFQARLRERKAELVDPGIAGTVEARLEGILRQSMDLVSERLVARDADVAVKMMDTATKALGFGARDRGAAVANNFVVVMPQPSATVGEWERSVAGVSEGVGQVVEAVEAASPVPGRARGFGTGAGAGAEGEAHLLPRSGAGGQVPDGAMQAAWEMIEAGLGSRDEAGSEAEQLTQRRAG